MKVKILGIDCNDVFDFNKEEIEMNIPRIETKTVIPKAGLWFAMEIVSLESIKKLLEAARDEK